MFAVMADATPDWMDEALCHDYEGSVFFPDSIQGVNYAKRICAWCPAMEDCAMYALEQRIEHGIWGGLSERHRKKVIKGTPVQWPTRDPRDVEAGGPPTIGHR